MYRGGGYLPTYPGREAYREGYPPWYRPVRGLGCIYGFCQSVREPYPALCKGGAITPSFVFNLREEPVPTALYEGWAVFHIIYQKTVYTAQPLLRAMREGLAHALIDKEKVTSPTLVQGG